MTRSLNRFGDDLYNVWYSCFLCQSQLLSMICTEL